MPVAVGVLPSAVAAPANPTAVQASSSAPGLQSSSTVDGGDARVVVGVIDSGINPYHEAFQVEESSVTPEVLAELGVTEDRVVTLTRTGDVAADLAADQARVWDRIEPGKPYWFTGTNIVAASFTTTGRRILPNSPTDTHGVGVTASVLGANPEAVVLFAEGINDAAETWTFTHPAVDVVTTSYGPVGSPPLGSHLTATYEGVVELGKLHTGAADNSPALSPFDSTSGPWWSVGVGGYQEGSSEGRQVLSGNVVDFVGDFTQTLPYCDVCQTGGTRSVSGTSFATPTSAGVASRVLLEARRAAGHRGGIVTEGVEAPLMVAGDSPLTVWDLRRALEQAAHLPRTSDFQPGGGTSEITSVPVVDGAAWAQTGWGLLSPDPAKGVVREALAHLGVEGTPTRTKDAATCAFGTAQFELRKAYWDRLALFSDSSGTSADPYERC
ncbi:MAG TPA: S8 family serine peptidase [Mycobacteriales bacterium]|nr:S8 family serine peptidase [Mycobacteriales bacterium]